MRRSISLAAFLVLALTASSVEATAAPQVAPSTTLVSVSSSGQPADGFAGLVVSVSATGRFVAFDSDAPNLVPGDTNGQRDVFVRDRLTAKTIRASVSTAGVQGNAMSYAPRISADGRYVTFTSYASNLVAGDTNGVGDAFVRDLVTRKTVRVSVSSRNVQGDGDSGPAGISSDGRFIAFTSWAANLVPRDTNNRVDAFVRDMCTGITSRIDLTSSGGQLGVGGGAEAISADGRWVLFASTSRVLAPGNNVINDQQFRKDRLTGRVTLVSASPSGRPANNFAVRGAMSADGRFVVFASDATNLVSPPTSTRDIYLRDLATGATRRVGRDGDDAAISADGRFVAFDSFSALLPADRNDTFDVYTRDRLTGNLQLISVTPAGVASNGLSGFPALSGSGRFVAFESLATDLVRRPLPPNPNEYYIRDQGLPLP